MASLTWLGSLGRWRHDSKLVVPPDPESDSFSLCKRHKEPDRCNRWVCAVHWHSGQDSQEIGYPAAIQKPLLLPARPLSFVRGFGARGRVKEFNPSPHTTSQRDAEVGFEPSTRGFMGVVARGRTQNGATNATRAPIRRGVLERRCRRLRGGQPGLPLAGVACHRPNQAHPGCSYTAQTQRSVRAGTSATDEATPSGRVTRVPSAPQTTSSTANFRSLESPAQRPFSARFGTSSLGTPPQAGSPSFKASADHAPPDWPARMVLGRDQ